MQFKKKQIFLVKKTANFFKKKSKNIKISSPSLYLITFAHCVGYFKLIMWTKKINFSYKFFYLSIKDFLHIGFLSTLNIKKDPRLQHTKYDRLIISWLDSNQNLSDLYKDKYFNLKVNHSKNTCFFYIGTNSNQKILPNSIIISPGKKKFNLFFFLKVIFYFLKNNKLNLFRLIKLTSTDIYSEILFNFIKNNVDLKRIKKIYIPYEGQPHQNFILYNIKKINNKLTTIGYVHAGLPALPTNYIKRLGHPDKILVNGVSQKQILYKFLGWKKNDIIIKSSSRFIKANISKKPGIYLPIFLDDLNYANILENFFKLLKSQKIYPLEVFNHPSQKKSIVHLKLIERLKVILKRNKNFFSKKEKINKYFICMGPTTSPLLFLEGGNKVLHITQRPEFDIFCYGYENYITLKKLNNFIFKYEIKKFNKLIKTKKTIFKIDTL